ncbi:putative outer membrane protein [Janthinobacterium sp. HH01]|nr:putative outer membrane protein [Janthinobacterium sp. HH01]
MGNWHVSGVDVRVKHYAASVVGTLPLASDFFVLGRLGYSRLEAGASIQGRRFSVSDNGALVGVGIGYHFTPALSGRLEFQKPSSDSRNLGVSVAYQF